MSIKGTFNYALHEGKRYMAVTMYKASGNERKYNFLVLDLKEKAIAEMDSIREAKAAILELVEEEITSIVNEFIGEPAQEEVAVEQEGEAEPAEAEAEENSDGNEKSKKTKA